MKKKKVSDLLVYSSAIDLIGIKKEIQTGSKMCGGHYYLEEQPWRRAKRRIRIWQKWKTWVKNWGESCMGDIFETKKIIYLEEEHMIASKDF